MLKPAPLFAAQPVKMLKPAPLFAAQPVKMLEPAPLFAAQPVKILEPAPLFAAQPTKVFWLTFFSKKVSGFLPCFFQKSGGLFSKRLESGNEQGEKWER